MSEIILVGLNHKFAPLHVRERLAFQAERLPQALQQLACRLAGGDSLAPPAEAVILATCNRVEVYNAAAEGGGTQSTGELEAHTLAFLADHAGLPLATLQPFLYTKRADAAVCHLFTVAAGLDSLVPGENEILGQVKNAAETARQAGTCGPTLSALFRQAAQCGKSVRSETELGHAGHSTAKAVVELAEEQLGPLAAHTALLIGAGKISSLAAAALQRAQLNCILVANRTYERAARLAGRYGGQVVHFDQLHTGLVAADLVICSTGAPHFVLHAEAVAAALRQRPQRPLFIADLAVPRDVDPAVAGLPGVTLADIDGLQELVCRRYPVSAAARLQAEARVARACEAFTAWQQARRNAPIIRALQEYAEEVCRRQVEKTRRRLGELTPEQEEALLVMGRAIAGKLLHAPILSLRNPPDDLAPEEVAALVERLYALDSCN